MVKLASLAAFIAVLLVASVLPVLAEPQVIITYEPERQGPAEVGKPTEFMRSGTIYNSGTEASAVEAMADVVIAAVDEPVEAVVTIKLDGHAKITKVVLDGIEYFNSVKDVVKFKKHSVKITVPANTLITFEMHYLMPAPTMKFSILQNTASNFLSKFTVSTNYEQHVTNVVAPITVPELPADWTYSAFANEADGSKRQLRYYLKDSDGSGLLDEIGVVVPQLSTVDGELEGQLLPSPSKLLNYKFQQVRADNVLLLFGWVTRQSLDFNIEDQGDPTYNERTLGPGWLYGAWFYNPLSDEGYDDNSSLRVRSGGQFPIFAPPVNATTSFNFNFKYKPGFAADCAWQNGIEIMFPEGPYFGDTTYHFYLWGNGNATNIDLSDILVASSTPDVNGWYDINISRTLDSNGEARVLRYFAMPGANCADTPYGPGEFWIDNVILTTN